MKNIFRILIISLLTFAANSSHAVVGYINYQFYTGDNFFQNNLSQPGNLLSQVMNISTPEGATVSLWDPLTRAFGPSSVWNGVQWSTDFALPPGVGAQLTSPAPFTNTFVGEVVSRDGGPWENFAYPPPFSGPNGIYLLGDKMPVSGGDVFMRVIGRQPLEGEQVIYQDGTTFTWTGGSWDDPTGPTLAPCQAALFNIGAVEFTYVVPEPAVTALGLLGLALVTLRRRS